LIIEINLLKKEMDNFFSKKGIKISQSSTTTNSQLLKKAENNQLTKRPFEIFSKYNNQTNHKKS